MNRKTVSSKRLRLWRLVATLVLVAAGVWLVATNWQTFWDGFRAAAQARPGWALLALLLTGLTFALAAAVYRLLALRPVHYRQLLVVEVASAFTNRLLPAGLGGMGLHGLYLYHRKHNVAESTAVVSVNNLLGITAHLCLLVALICFRPEVLRRLNTHGLQLHWWYGLIAAAAACAVVAYPKLRRTVGAFGRNLAASLRPMKLRRIALAAVLALLLTSTYTLVLFCSADAVHVSLGLLQIFVVFSAGMLVGTATPTPGGLVGVEAGLLAGFMAYGVAVPAATAAVIMYRLLTYWLPLVPGVIALLLARRRRFV